MDSWIGAVAIGAPVLQGALMGMIGYPIAQRRPGGMEAFRRSGFLWWIITLATIVLVGLATAPRLLRLTSPSVHHVNAPRFLVTVVIALVVLLVIEVSGDAWHRHSKNPAALAGRERYDSALPLWAHDLPAESVLVTGVAALEEAVYRGIALGALLTAWNLSKPASAGAVAVAFGLAHWYFGARQVLLKLLAGSVLCAAALSAGWFAAAIAHITFNLVLVALERRTRV